MSLDAALPTSTEDDACRALIVAEPSVCVEQGAGRRTGRLRLISWMPACLLLLACIVLAERTSTPADRFAASAHAQRKALVDGFLVAPNATGEEEKAEKGERQGHELARKRKDEDSAAEEPREDDAQDAEGASAGDEREERQGHELARKRKEEDRAAEEPREDDAQDAEDGARKTWWQRVVLRAGVCVMLLGTAGLFVYKGGDGLVAELPLVDAGKENEKQQKLRTSLGGVLYVVGLCYWFLMPLLLFGAGYASTCVDGAPAWAYLITVIFGVLQLVAIMTTWKVYQGKLSRCSTMVTTFLSLLEYSDMSSDALSIGVAAACDAEVEGLWLNSWDAAFSGLGSLLNPPLRVLGLEGSAILFFFFFAWLPQVFMLPAEIAVPISGGLFVVYFGFDALLAFLPLIDSAPRPLLSYVMWTWGSWGEQWWVQWAMNSPIIAGSVLSVLVIISCVLCCLCHPCVPLVFFFCIVPAIVPVLLALEWAVFHYMFGILILQFLIFTIVATGIPAAYRGSKTPSTSQHRAFWAGIYLLDDMNKAEGNDVNEASKDEEAPKQAPRSDEKEAPEQAPRSDEEAPEQAPGSDEKDAPPEEGMDRVIAALTKLMGENVIQLGFQSSLFALTVHKLSHSGKIKQLVSLGISLATTAQKLLAVTGSILAGDPAEIGIPRYMAESCIVFLGWLLLLWAPAKVAMAFQCPSGVWSITYGCVSATGSLDM